MGYRSEVGCLITVPAKVNSEKLVKKIHSLYQFDNVKILDRYGVRLIYLHDSWVKWYEECYDDVKAFMEFVHNWPYKTGGVHFLRIGESYDDVEEIVKGEPQEYIQMERSMSV